MPKQLSTRFGLSHAPFRIAGRYALFGFLWIWLSDWVFNLIGFTAGQVFLAGAVKGTLFVTLTAGLLYWLVRKELAAAQRSDILLRAVVDGTSDSVFVKDKDGRYLLCNEAAANFLGRTVAEVLGRDDRELMDGNSASKLIENDRVVMAGRKSVTLEETISSGGLTLTYHVTKAPFFDSVGEIAGLIGVARDITERKASDDALRDSEERWRELANAIPQIVWMANADGRVTHLNAKGLEYLGLSGHLLEKWRWIDVIHPDDQAYAASTWAQVVAEGQPRVFEMRIRNADGHDRWHIGRQCPIRDSAGQIVSWVGTNTDIHDLKQAENTLRETEARLREAQRIARLGSWNWQPATNQVWWSAAEFELFGLERDSIVPSFEAFLAILHPEDRALAIKRVEEMLAGAEEFANDLRIIRPDGQILWIHSRARASRDAEGRILIVAGTDQDVTEKVRTERQLRSERDRFEKLMEAVPAALCSFHLSNDGQVTMPYASHRIEPIYGLTPDQLARDASPLFSMFHPDDAPRIHESIAESARTMSLWREEFRVHSPVLGDIWIEGCSSPIRLSDGSVLWHGYINDVTERRKINDALRDSERRLRLALESAGSVAFTWDITSDKVTRYGSVHPDQPIVSEHMGSMNDVRAKIHREDLGSFDRQLSHCLTAGADYQNAYRVIRDDGEVTSIEEYGYFDRSADGRPLHLTGILVDVTGREAATEALRASKARYRQLVDILPTAIFVHDNNVILYGNPAFLRMIGAETPEELAGHGLFDLAHPSDHEAMKHRHDLLARGNASVPGFEMRLMRLDGRPVPVYSVAARISGYGPDATLVAVTDLTERERANQLLSSVLNSVGDAILTIDEHGIIGSANPSAGRQFGYSVNELIGQNVSILMPDDHARAHNGYLTNYLRTGIAKAIGIGREVECRRRDNTRFTAELSITEFLLEGERRFTGVLRDITERQRLQAQFIQAQKMEAVGRLAGGVAHDFNNLLTIISGYCDFLMMSDMPSGDGQREAIAAIRDAGERAARLTQQLLAFSRKAVIEPKLLDLNELVSDSAKLLRRLIGEDIMLAVVTAPRPIRIKADPGQLEQVIMNLVVNARDAMPTGGRLTIETSIVVPAGATRTEFAQLSVSDTGTGMSNEVKAKIFEPFFTTKGMGKGTGLGLAVVHGVVTQSGGQIQIESTEGVGTTFQILLPLIDDAASSTTAESIRFANRGTETILLVEDDAAVRRITRLSLETQGYKVLEADGGSAAIQLAEKYPEQIDLLVSDVVMPEMGGRQLLNAVRKHRQGLRVLFISGYTEDAVLLHGVVEATDSFMSKPFTPLSLARKVREVIDAPGKSS